MLWPHSQVVPWVICYCEVPILRAASPLPFSSAYFALLPGWLLGCFRLGRLMPLRKGPDGTRVYTLLQKGSFFGWL